MCLAWRLPHVHLWTNDTIVFNNIFQLTPEAERKVVQSRELLDTIVKENKGCNINKIRPLQHDPAAAEAYSPCIHYLLLTWTSYSFQLSMELRPVLANLPGRLFLSASWSKVTPLLEKSDLFSCTCLFIICCFVVTQRAAGEPGALALSR